MNFLTQDLLDLESPSNLFFEKNFFVWSFGIFGESEESLVNWANKLLDDKNIKIWKNSEISFWFNLKLKNFLNFKKKKIFNMYLFIFQSPFLYKIRKFVITKLSNFLLRLKSKTTQLKPTAKNSTSVKSAFGNFKRCRTTFKVVVQMQDAD